MKKKMTVRERLLEEKRKQEEAERGKKFRQNLVRVKIITRPFTVLHGIPIFYCGYCGSPMALFSSRPVQIGKKLPPLYYACRKRCPHSGFHRAEFIDKMLLQLIQRRITENFPEPKEQGDYEALLKKFKLLDKLHSERLELLNKMHYASYKRDEILRQLSDMKDEINSIQEEIHSLFSSGASENPLMNPLFNTPPENINELDLEYRRELVKLTTRRIRFFNEFLIATMLPLTEKEKETMGSMGKTYNINLRVADRAGQVELPSKDEIEKSEVAKIEPVVEKKVEIPDKVPEDAEIEFE
ncbi:zinc ribbon domain-containing protein [bacterium]|nr:zinc ribbon domain-containing protein [bacterium]